MLPLPLKLKGAPGSPYTRKMMAVLRFRHIPFELMIGNQASKSGMPEAKVNLLPTFYLPDERGELEAVVDSTPLIRRFEAAFEGRHVVPPDPALAFINYLIEDYGDEWLTKAMFHYRWHYPADIEMAARILPRWTNISMSDADLDRMSKYIAQRQISRLYVVGSNDITAPVIEDSYRRFLAIMDRMIQQHPFTMGRRPGSGDFALYAQLTQLAKFDPTPAAICLAQAPRVYAWTDVVDDLSGWPAAADAWVDIEEAGYLQDLLTEIGRVYVPALLANAAAMDKSQQEMSTTIDGRPWTQPVFGYQAKCLQWIRQEYVRLEEHQRAQVDRLLAGTGCEALL